MIQGSGIEGNMAEIPVSNIRDSSAYKVVVIEGNGAMRHSLVPKWKLNTKSAFKGQGRTHGFLAG